MKNHPSSFLKSRLQTWSLIHVCVCVRLLACIYDCAAVFLALLIMSKANIGCRIKCCPVYIVNLSLEAFHLASALMFLNVILTIKSVNDEYKSWMENPSPVWLCPSQNVPDYKLSQCTAYVSPVQMSCRDKAQDLSPIPLGWPIGQPYRSVFVLGLKSYNFSAAQVDRNIPFLLFLGAGTKVWRGSY